MGVIGRDICSGVAKQPFKEEVIRGAINRAESALKLIKADFGIGIEGDVIKPGKKWYNLGFIVVINGDGKIGTGTSGWFECPSEILKKLKNGKELGEIIDELTRKKDAKNREGAIVFFAKGKVVRKDLYKHGVFMVLVPFLSPLDMFNA